MTLWKKLSAATIAAITSGTLILGSAGVAMAGDSGRDSRATVEHSDSHAVDPAAVEDALRALLAANPQLIGSPLCPEVHTGDDATACLEHLEGFAPAIAAILGRLDAADPGQLLQELVAPVIACVEAGNSPELCVITALKGLVTTG